ncbi:CMP-sialic acid transporter 5 [Capsicum baccatum]|uniref:CMP-sialic acid transporter 5 n=1 Tax=Capsicum baccatum TaxID=33114 RepID=A0A2G2WT54_CAPBA|nr:CMP-sialic acid transporter 5 [Capsicum baccatum]
MVTISCTRWKTLENCIVVPFQYVRRREVIVTSSVLTCEVVKVICALILMAKEGTLKKIYREWTLFGSLTASGLPAAIYALQNSLLQISYKNLDSLTFSILNQTKLFFTALFTYMILRPCLEKIIDQAYTLVTFGNRSSA